MLDKKILVVDDDPGILDVISTVLSEEGYQVFKTARGDEVEKLPEQLNYYPNLILLDVSLSGKDGRIITQKLKTDDKTKHIPIVLMSAIDSVQDQATSIGAAGFLSKPFDIDHLLNTIKRYIN